VLAVYSSDPEFPKSIKFIPVIVNLVPSSQSY